MATEEEGQEWKEDVHYPRDQAVRRGEKVLVFYRKI